MGESALTLVQNLSLGTRYQNMYSVYLWLPKDRIQTVSISSNVQMSSQIDVSHCPNPPPFRINCCRCWQIA